MNAYLLNFTVLFFTLLMLFFQYSHLWLLCCSIPHSVCCTLLLPVRWTASYIWSSINLPFASIKHPPRNTSSSSAWTQSGFKQLTHTVTRLVQCESDESICWLITTVVLHCPQTITPRPPNGPLIIWDSAHRVFITSALICVCIIERKLDLWEPLHAEEEASSPFLSVHTTADMRTNPVASSFFVCCAITVISRV